MKIEWNAKTGLPTFKIDEEVDFVKVQSIKELLASRGWAALKDFLECERMKLEAKIDACVSPMSKASDESVRVLVAKKVGFKHFENLAENIVLQYDALKKISEDDYQEKEDLQNATGRDDFE